MWTHTITATFKDNENLSDAINLQSWHLTGVAIPEGFTGTVLTFKVSVDGGVTYLDLFDSLGQEYSVTVKEGCLTLLDPNHFAGISNLRLRSGVGSSPINQLGAKTVKLVARQY